MPHFADRLSARIKYVANPVVVGLDPRRENLPRELKAQEAVSFLERARAYETFCRGIIDVVADLVPAVKPQMAFFEELGPAGMTALSNIVAYARQKQLIVILDGKRNDIGSTAKAYASAYLGSEASAWGADALTVSPYLGDDSLIPFVEAAEQNATGFFVLVKTSNPGGGTLQDVPSSGRPIYRIVADLVEGISVRTAGTDGYGVAGAVVGATYPEQIAELRAAMPHAYFLVPGFGSQGGTAADVAQAFDDQGLGAVINSSRAIIFAYDRPEFQRHRGSSWQSAVEAATRDMIQQLREETPAGKIWARWGNNR